MIGILGLLKKTKGGGGSEAAMLSEMLRLAGLEVEASELLAEDRKEAFEGMVRAALRPGASAMLLRGCSKQGARIECLLVLNEAAGSFALPVPSPKKVLDTAQHSA